MAVPLAGWTVDATLAHRAGRVVLRARRGHEAPVIVKASAPGAGWAARAGLRREGRLLDVVRGEGVVDLLDVIDRRGRTALLFDVVPAGTLLDRPAPDPETAARRLEGAVHHLHRAGVVHGALRPEHVALDADGRPVLLGFGSARRTTATTATTTDDIDLAALLQALRSGA